MNRVALPNKDYYVLLAERLQSLLKDMEAAGTPVDDDLVRRLRSLLEETQRQISSSN